MADLGAHNLLHHFWRSRGCSSRGGLCGSPSPRHLRGGCGDCREGGWSRSKGLRRLTAWCGRESCWVRLEEARGRWLVCGGGALPGEFAPCGCRREEARRRDFFQLGVGSDGEGKGGPVAGKWGRVCAGGV
jgi:hypothetical protein